MSGRRSSIGPIRVSDIPRMRLIFREGPVNTDNSNQDWLTDAGGSDIAAGLDKRSSDEEQDLALTQLSYA